MRAEGLVFEQGIERDTLVAAVNIEMHEVAIARLQRIGIGTGLIIADIAATAEDITQDLEKGNVKDAAKRLGETGANVGTLGLYGAGKQISEKRSDRAETMSEIEAANRQNEKAYDLAVQKTLLKNYIFI